MKIFFALYCILPHARVLLSRTTHIGPLRPENEFPRSFPTNYQSRFAPLSAGIRSPRGAWLSLRRECRHLRTLGRRRRTGEAAGAQPAARTRNPPPNSAARPVCSAWSGSLPLPRPLRHCGATRTEILAEQVPLSLGGGRAAMARPVDRHREDPVVERGMKSSGVV